MNRRVLAILVALLALPSLAGCGDDSPQQAIRTRHVLRMQPEQDARVSTAAANPPPVASDPLDSDASQNHLAQADPLDAGGDSLENGNSLAGQDPLSAVGTNNWYWLRGNITGGAIAIAVDGVSMGEYTVHMDKEITRMLHPGVNTLTFTPKRDNPLVPVQAHLEVVYSQMQPGEPPPLIFDTRQTIKPAAIPGLVAPPPVYKPVEPDDGAQPDQPPPPTPPIHLPVAALDPPVTMTFVAQ